MDSVNNEGQKKLNTFRNVALALSEAYQNCVISGHYTHNKQLSPVSLMYLYVPISIERYAQTNKP